MVSIMKAPGQVLVWCGVVSVRTTATTHHHQPPSSGLNRLVQARPGKARQGKAGINSFEHKAS